MINSPIFSNRNRPLVLLAMGAIALVIVVALLIAAIPHGNPSTDVASQGQATTTAAVGAVSSPSAGMAANAATPASTTPAKAIPASASPSALISGGWGSGPEGDAGGTRSYPGPGPQGDVDVAWRLSIPSGYNVGSPVVYGNRLLVTATSEAFGSNLTVYELESGRFLWSYAESFGFSSPFVATGRVFVTAERSLIALSLETGEVLWTQEVADGVELPEAEDVEGQRGSLSNPVADGNSVIVTAGSNVIALDAATGTEIWRHAFAGTQVYWPRMLGDIVTVISLTAGEDDGAPRVERYHGLSLETGNEVWRQDTVGPLTFMASADAGVVFVNDFRGGELETRMFDARTGSPVRVEATCAPLLASAAGETVACGPFDALTGEPLPGADAWPEESAIGASTDDVLYLESAGSRLVAVDQESGEARWSLDLAAVVLDDDLTFVTPGVISVGDNAVAVEVLLTDEETGEPSRAIWIVGAASEPAATPVAGGTPAASPVAGATPEDGE